MGSCQPREGTWAPESVDGSDGSPVNDLHQLESCRIEGFDDARNGFVHSG